MFKAHFYIMIAYKMRHLRPSVFAPMVAQNGTTEKTKTQVRQGVRSLMSTFVSFHCTGALSLP